MGTLGAKRLIKTSVAPPSSGAQGMCPTCHTLDTPLRPSRHYRAELLKREILFITADIISPYGQIIHSVLFINSND